jgi:hypothetical protein
MKLTTIALASAFALSSTFALAKTFRHKPSVRQGNESRLTTHWSEDFEQVLRII